MNPIMKHALMLMANVPTGNRDPKRSAAKTPTTYRSIAPNAPPIAINIYRLNLAFLLSLSLQQYLGSALHHGQWRNSARARGRVVQSRSEAAIGIHAMVTDVIRNSPSKSEPLTNLPELSLGPS
jgi:hypothetical protein